MRAEELRIHALILRPIRKSWKPLLDSLEMFSEDFLETGREQPTPQDRDEAFP